MAFDLGYVADSDEEGEPGPRKRSYDAVVVTPKSTARADSRPCSSSQKVEGPPRKRQTLLSFGKPAACVEDPGKATQPAADVKVESEEGAAEEGAAEDGAQPVHEGYTLLHRVLDRALPRYGQLLTPKEVAALRNFTRLSLPARQLLARLLTRKWPQWVPMDNLGARYRELGVAEAQAAAAELAGTSVRSEVPGEGSDWSRYLAELPADQEDPTPWLLDTASETAASLLQTPLPTKEENLGRLLLQALPAAELRRMGRGLGMGNSKGGGQRGAKGKLLAQVCEAARQQRPLIAESTENSEAHLVSEALTLGRRLCLAPCPGRAALGVLSELFRLESCGAPEVSYVLFTTRWPDFPFKEPAPPLFQDRASLDAFLDARALVAGLQDFQRPTLASAEEDAQRAEERLQKALALEGNAFEAAKFQDPFRRRFTAAWCYAEERVGNTLRVI
ncbi:unnamed protein product [Effrenium voratum]|nr:unnamed protein product [Effrenium voratum]